MGSARWFRWKEFRGPGRDDNVSRYSLRGERTEPAVRIIVLQDRSGSMAPYAAVRDETLAAIFEWAPKNLLPDDEFGVIDFADQAGVAMELTSVSRLDIEKVGIGAPSGGTLIRPPISLVMDWLSPVKPVWILALSDGEIFDRITLAEARVLGTSGGTVLINPAYGVLPKAWEASFPDSHLVTLEGDTAGSAAVGIARALAIVVDRRIRGGSLA